MRKLYTLVILILISSCTRSQLSIKQVNTFLSSNNTVATLSDTELIEAVNAAATGPAEEENLTAYAGENAQVTASNSSVRVPIYSHKSILSSTKTFSNIARKQEKRKRPTAVTNSHSLWKKREDEPKSNGTNGFAIASLVVGLVGIPFLAINGIFTLLAGVLAIIFGAIARKQLKKNDNAQQGKGLALAGFIVGIVEAGIIVLVLLFALAIVASR